MIFDQNRSGYSMLKHTLGHGNLTTMLRDLLIQNEKRKEDIFFFFFLYEDLNK